MSGTITRDNQCFNIFCVINKKIFDNYISFTDIIILACNLPPLLVYDKIGSELNVGYKYIFLDSYYRFCQCKFTPKVYNSVSVSLHLKFIIVSV